MTVFINCKWMSQTLTGTQRYASEITRRLLALEHCERLVLVVPSDAVIPGWCDRDVVLVRSRFRGFVFEQLALPFITRGRLLINLGGPAPLLKFRQVATMHDASFIRLPETYSKQFVLWYKVMYKLLSLTARRVLSVSHFSARELCDYLNVPLASISVVPNGADHMDDLDAEDPRIGIAKSLPFALCVGTLARHKNLRPVVEELRRADIVVVIVGAAGSSRVFSTGSEMDDEGVVVAGRLSDSELKWLYGQATALVFPSLYEGFGLPVVEAQRCGCPVISSGRASLTEVGGGATAYFDAEKPATVVDEFLRIRDDEFHRQRLVESGLRNAERYSWADSAAQVSKVISDERHPRKWSAWRLK